MICNTFYAVENGTEKGKCRNFKMQNAKIQKCKNAKIENIFSENRKM